MFGYLNDKCLFGFSQYISCSSIFLFYFDCATVDKQKFLISDENNVILEKVSYGANSVAQLLLL